LESVPELHKCLKIRALKWPSDFSKGIDSVELMPRVLKSLKIQALNIYTLFKGTASLEHKKYK